MENEFILDSLVDVPEYEIVNGIIIGIEIYFPPHRLKIYHKMADFMADNTTWQYKVLYKNDGVVEADWFLEEYLKEVV